MWCFPIGLLQEITTEFSDLELDAELVDVRRDNHDLVEWSNGYGPAAKLSVYFTLIVEGTSLISGPGLDYELGSGDGVFVREYRFASGGGPVIVGDFSVEL